LQLQSKSKAKNRGNMEMEKAGLNKPLPVMSLKLPSASQALR
jgi:hypothetical protein